MPLYLPQALAGEVLRHARQALPQECVGLLFGQEDHARRRAPLPNVASDPTRHFEADPERLLHALLEAEGRGEALIAIYHSHPKGPATPSGTDLARAHYQAYQLIVQPASGSLRAYRYSKTHYQEIAIIKGA